MTTESNGKFTVGTQSNGKIVTVWVKDGQGKDVPVNLLQSEALELVKQLINVLQIS